MRPTLPNRAELRLLLVVAALTLAPFIGLAVWASQGFQAVWEYGLLNQFYAPTGLADGFSTLVNSLGNLPLWAGVVAVSTLAVFARRGRRAAALVALSFASDLAAFAVKLVVESDRPATDAVQQIFGVDTFSFPSGHTVRAAALAAVVVWLLAPTRTRVPLAIAGALAAGLVMGYARVSLGVHWPSDTIGGTLLGIAWFALTTYLIFGILQPRQEADGSSS